MEASLLGRVAIGIDKNPLAVALARAKTQAVELEDVQARLRDLASEYSYASRELDCSEDIRTIFHGRTLDQLVYLREHLGDEPEDVFLRGVVLGILHGKHRRGGGSMYLSIDMPNTFSMSPDYVRRFVREHGLTKVPFDVFSKTRSRSREMLREGAGVQGGQQPLVLLGDAARAAALLGDKSGHVDAVITSPPYLGVLRYGAFNWIRLWFLGFGPAEVDRALDTTDSMDLYLAFIASFLRSTSKVLKEGGIVALAIGDVEEQGQCLSLASRLWEELKDLVSFELVANVVDNFDEASKTTRIWGEERKGRATKVERLLILRSVTDGL